MLKIKLSDYNIILHLVRHGEDEQDKIGGWSDNHLDEIGIKQILNLLPEIDDDYDVFYSSDLTRTKETSEILNTKLNMNIIYDKGFRETNNGILKNMTKKEFNERGYKRVRDMDYDEFYPGGESPRTFYLRVLHAFLNLIENNRNKKILLVTHGGVITIIKCLLDGIEYSNKLNIKPHCGELLKYK